MCSLEPRRSRVFVSLCPRGLKCFSHGSNIFSLWVEYFFLRVNIFSCRSRLFLVDKICFSWVQYVTNKSDFSSLWLKFFSCFNFFPKVKILFPWNNLGYFDRSDQRVSKVAYLLKLEELGFSVRKKSGILCNHGK